jgi:hypothetical protein
MSWFLTLPILPTGTLNCTTLNTFSEVSIASQCLVGHTAILPIIAPKPIRSRTPLTLHSPKREFNRKSWKPELQLHSSFVGIRAATSFFIVTQSRYHAPPTRDEYGAIIIIVFIICIAKGHDRQSGDGTSSSRPPRLAHSIRRHNRYMQTSIV